MASANEVGARRAAREVIDELEIDDYPIDPYVIAQAKHLPVDHRDGFPPGIYGMLWRTGNDFGIAISTDCPTPGHRRFTIAHELGHYHLDGHVEQLFRGADGQVPSLGGHFRDLKSPMEVEADAFAGELLVPTAFARTALAGTAIGMSAVLRLRDAFDVSLSCAAVRLAQLANEPVAVVLSRNGVVEWIARSEALFAQGTWARRSWRQEWIPRGSGTKRLATDTAQRHAGADDGSELLACEWFDGAPRTTTAIEEAVGLGSYDRVLTVLQFPNLPDPDLAYQREERLARGERFQGGDWRAGLRTYGWDEEDE